MPAALFVRVRVSVLGSWPFNTNEPFDKALNSLAVVTQQTEWIQSPVVESSISIVIWIACFYECQIQIFILYFFFLQIERKLN